MTAVLKADDSSAAGWAATPGAGRVVYWPTRSDISPLRYPGGKRKLGPLVADLAMRRRDRTALVVEPFAGGAAVSISLLEAGYTDEIVLNDVDPLIHAFWRTVFSKDSDQFASMVENAIVTVSEWYRVKKLRPGSMLEAAYQCLYLNRTSFSGSLHKEAGPMGGRAQAGGDLIGSRFNKVRIAARIRELGALAERVRAVENGSYSDTIRRHDATAVLWYLDPPFFAKANRLYRHHFDDAAHQELASRVDDLRGNWILSYDDHEHARELYGCHPGFTRIQLQYSAAVGAKRSGKHEIIVSDIIAAEREASRWAQERDHAIPRRSIRRDQRPEKRPRSI